MSPRYPGESWVQRFFVATVIRRDEATGKALRSTDCDGQYFDTEEAAAAHMVTLSVGLEVDEIADLFVDSDEVDGTKSRQERDDDRTDYLYDQARDRRWEDEVCA